jgi:hypothetical protein
LTVTPSGIGSCGHGDPDPPAADGALLCGGALFAAGEEGAGLAAVDAGDAAERLGVPPAFGSELHDAVVATSSAAAPTARATREEIIGITADATDLQRYLLKVTARAPG